MAPDFYWPGNAFTITSGGLSSLKLACLRRASLRGLSCGLVVGSDIGNPTSGVFSIHAAPDVMVLAFKVARADLVAQVGRCPTTAFTIRKQPCYWASLFTAAKATEQGRYLMAAHARASRVCPVGLGLGLLGGNGCVDGFVKILWIRWRKGKVAHVPFVLRLAEVDSLNLQRI
jgi:hypothetical protein